MGPGPRSPAGLYDQEPFINAGISDQDDDGIYVTGARMVGTLAPFSRRWTSLWPWPQSKGRNATRTTGCTTPTPPPSTPRSASTPRPTLGSSTTSTSWAVAATCRFPREAALEVAELAIDKYYKEATAVAKDKVALFRLAWDIVGSGWGGRQELYERFFFGDTQRMKSMNYQFYDKEEATAMVARLLTPPQDRQRLRWPDRYRPVPAGRLNGR